MVEKNFGSLQQFAKLYQFIGKQPRNRDEVSDFVMTGMSMKSKNTVRNYTEKVFEESNFSTKLRYPITPDFEKKILLAIATIQLERGITNESIKGKE